MQISAILSDYDGTLCPTASIRNKENNIIPEELENTLRDISEKIPICIVSSKDFDFLHNKTGFASVVSCLLGIETVTLRRHKRTMLSLNSKQGISSDKYSECREFECIKNSYLSIDDTRLQYNSELLSQLAEEIASRFNEISIERKFTLAKRVTSDRRA